VKELVLEAALVNDQIHFVGWDVALTPNGPLLIEGNRGPGFDIVQVLTNKGMKPMLEELVNEVERLEKNG
jgi:glutathione synthase/RimK-type ligase-like ATP-grasp enzyme